MLSATLGPRPLRRGGGGRLDRAGGRAQEEQDRALVEPQGKGSKFMKGVVERVAAKRKGKGKGRPRPAPSATSASSAGVSSSEGVIQSEPVRRPRKGKGKGYASI